MGIELAVEELLDLLGVASFLIRLGFFSLPKVLERLVEACEVDFGVRVKLLVAGRLHPAVPRGRLASNYGLDGDCFFVCIGQLVLRCRFASFTARN
jgi:hypothetical protein